MINLQEKIDKTITNDPHDFSKTTVSNIPVFYKQFDIAPCIHIRIVFKYGAKHDPVGKEGVAHFLEHMLFRGTNLFETEKDVENFKKNITLGTLNAHTGIFELVLKAKCLPYNLEKTLEGLMSMVTSPTLRENDFTEEKKIILDEAWRRFKNEKQIAYTKKLRASRLSNLPDRQRIVSALGWPDTIEKITHQDVLDAYKKNLVRENISFFFAGNLELVGGIEPIKTKLESHIASIPNGERAAAPHIPGSITPPTVAVFDNTYTDIGLSDKKQTSIDLAYTFPRIAKQQDDIASPEEELLIAALAITSRLTGDIVYEKLRIDNSWCYSAGSSFGVEPEYLRLDIKAELRPDHADEAIQICKNILQEIRDGKHKERFDQVKTLVIESTLAGERLTYDTISSVVDDYIHENQILTEKKALTVYNTVRFEDVQNFIKEYITPERLQLEILRPDVQKKSVLRRLFGLRK